MALRVAHEQPSCGRRAKIALVAQRRCLKDVRRQPLRCGKGGVSKVVAGSRSGVGKAVSQRRSPAAAPVFKSLCRRTPLRHHTECLNEVRIGLDVTV